MIDDMSYADLQRERASFIHSADSPCMDCPNREDGYCRFYQVPLEPDGFGSYYPCMECEDDCGV